MDRLNSSAGIDQDKRSLIPSPLPTMQVDYALVYSGSALGQRSTHQSPHGWVCPSRTYVKGWEAGSIDVHVNPRYPNPSLDVPPWTYRHISHRSTAPFWTAQHQHDLPSSEMCGMREISGNNTMNSRALYCGHHTVQFDQCGSDSTSRFDHIPLLNTHTILSPASLSTINVKPDMHTPMMLTGQPALMENPTLRSVGDHVDLTARDETPYVEARTSSLSRVFTNVNAIWEHRAPLEHAQYQNTGRVNRQEGFQRIGNVRSGTSAGKQSIHNPRPKSRVDLQRHPSISTGSLEKTATRRTVDMAELVNRKDSSRHIAKLPHLKLTIACQGCRKKKRKCSAERPACAACKGRGLNVCIYADTIRRRGLGRKKLAAIELIARDPSRCDVRVEDGILDGYFYRNHNPQG